MKLPIRAHLNLFFAATILIASCQQKSPPSPKVAPTLKAVTVVPAQPQTYWPKDLSTLKTIPLEKLPELMMGKNVMINTICLLEKNDPDEPLKHWYLACDTSTGMEIRFLENYEKEPHSLLVIYKDTIVLDSMHFQFDKVRGQPIGEDSYWFSSDQVK